MRPGIDLVMPVYNEEKVLPEVLGSLESQSDLEGRLLPRGAFRVIAVDNASSDGSRDLLERFAAQPGGPPVTVLSEPIKGVVAARIRGGDFALQDSTRPVIVHADSDSIFPRTFIDTIARRFARHEIDVLSYLGFEPSEFWRKVPRLARRQFLEVGSISFSPETLSELGFDERAALLTPEIYRDFQNVPTQCGFAMTKEIYRRVGGYVREFNRDGTERLGEARNLAFRLDRAGARFDHVLSPPVDVNPRRYLLEAADLWAGRSYTQGMTDLRDDIQPQHYIDLERAGDLLDYETARRNAVQRYIVDPCIARPQRLLTNRKYFGAELANIERRIDEFHAATEVRYYVEARPFSDRLVDDSYRAILANIGRFRGLDREAAS